MVKKVTSHYHSSHLYDIAKNSVNGIKTEKNDPIIPIMFSVLALEAFINETGSLARVVPTSKQQKIIEGFSSVMSELEERKESLLVKYHLGLLVFSGATWDEGSQPFQDFKLLVNIRNSIVHMKTDRWETTIHMHKPHPERTLKQYPKFVAALKQKGLIEEPKLSESWLQAIAQPKVAEWACSTAEKVTSEFYKVVPKGHYKNQLTELIFKF